MHDGFLIIPVSNASHITIRDGVVRLCTLQGKYYTLNMTLEEAQEEWREVIDEEADNQLDP